MFRSLAITTDGLLCGLFLLLGCAANANPLLLAPTGATLTTGQFRAEAALSPGNDHGKYMWFATGVKQLELNAVRIDNRAGGDETLVGLQWSFVPETIFTPAISFGARDVAFQSAEGIGVYVAVTRHLPIGEASWFLRDFAVTAGVGAGGIRGPFAGFQADLPWRLYAEGEYDSGDFNAAIGWKPVDNVRLKLYTIRGDLYYGAEWLSVSF